MIIFPAIDLRRGAVVQLVGGSPDEEKVRLSDPAGRARDWVAAGFRALHVVDLDAALGDGSNREHVAAILNAVEVPVQVGGGVRDRESVDALLELGADRVVVGTRAVEDPAWLEELAAELPGRLVVAADARDGSVVTHGWTAQTGLSVAALLNRLEVLPVAGVLVTDVGREGRLQGANVAGFAELASWTRHRLLASGGITTLDDLRGLRDAGVAGAVLGMALYTGALDAAGLVAEFHDTTPEAS